MALQFQSAKTDFIYSGSVETTTQGLLQRKLRKIIPRWEGKKKIKSHFVKRKSVSVRRERDVRQVRELVAEDQPAPLLQCLSSSTDGRETC